MERGRTRRTAAIVSRRLAFQTILVVACSALALARQSASPVAGGAGPAVPFLFVPGYAASGPKPGTVASFTIHRGTPPEDLILSVSYKPFVRSLENAGYVEGQSFFGAPYDWRMPAAPDDGVFDGRLDLVTARSITSGTWEYAVNYLGYWLDQAVQANPGIEYVDMASHSTGNVLVRAYIQSPAYGASYVDGNGIRRRLPKIRYYIAGAGINEGTVHSWRPWSGNFEDVLSGFIPTTEIEGRLAAAAYALVSAGGKVSGPDYDITRSLILRPDKNGRRAADPVTFFRLYDPMRQRVMPTNDFLTLPGSTIPTNVNGDPELRSDVALDLNAASTPADNPWALEVGIRTGQGLVDGGAIATFATGARDKKSTFDFFIPGLVNENPFICTATAIEQLPSGRGEFVPLVGLLKPHPTPVPVTRSRFPRVGDDEIDQQLNGDGNGFTASYLSTYPGDPNVEVVTWGNGPRPAAPPIPPEDCAAASSVPEWTNETNYPVYHVVFYYNPDVRNFIVTTLTGEVPPPEVVITPGELFELTRYLDGRAF
jgi:hypothetical protein